MILGIIISTSFRYSHGYVLSDFLKMLKNQHLVGQFFQYSHFKHDLAFTYLHVQKMQEKVQ